LAVDIPVSSEPKRFPPQKRETHILLIMMLDVSLPWWVEGWTEIIPYRIVSIKRLSAVPTPSESLFMLLQMRPATYHFSLKMRLAPSRRCCASDLANCHWKFAHPRRSLYV